MVQKSIFTFILSLTLIGLIPHTPAHAGYEGGSQVEYVEDSVNLLPQHFFKIELFNNPQISESKFTMRLIAPGVVSGCANVGDGFLTADQRKIYKMIDGVEAKFITSKLKISFMRPELILDDQNPRFTNYDCDINDNYVMIDIKLDRDELIKNETEKFQFELVGFDGIRPFGTYEIDVNEQRFIFKDGSRSGTTWFTQWFFPENAVILHAPKAKLGVDVQNLIREFGISQGLTPIENAFKKFELPYDANNYVFFINPSEHFVKQLDKVGDNITVGDITANRTVYGANGAVEEPYNLIVQATLPGHSK